MQKKWMLLIICLTFFIGLVSSQNLTNLSEINESLNASNMTNISLEGNYSEENQTDIFFRARKIIEKINVRHVIYFFVGLLVIYILFKIFSKEEEATPSEDLRGYIKGLGRTSAGNFVNKKTLKVDSEDSLMKAIEIFMENSLNVLAVVKNGEIQGMLPKLKLLSEIYNKYSSLEEKKVKDIMEEDFETFKGGRLKDICEALLKSKTDSVAILNEARDFIGTVDYFDILNCFSKSKFVIENPPIVGDAMSKDFNSVSSEENVLNLVKKMIANKKDYALVIKENKAIGIVTIKDLLSSIYKGVNLEKTKVQMIMSPRLVSLSPGSSIKQAISIMLERKFNQIPAIDKDKIYGVLELKGVVKTYYDFLNEVEDIRKDFLVKKVEFRK